MKGIGVAVLGALVAAGCGGTEPGQPLLTAEMPVHLEAHLDAAAIERSEPPADIPEPVEWRFDQPQPDWKAASPFPDGWDPVAPTRVDDGLRIHLTAAQRNPWGRLDGTVFVELPDWRLQDWGYVEIRARTSDPMQTVGLSFNYTEEDPYLPNTLPFYSPGDRAPLVTDGTVQTYRLSLDWPRMRRWDGSWTHLAVWFTSREGEEETTFDLLSVRVIPAEAEFASARVGHRMVGRSARDDVDRVEPQRRALYMHAPGSLSYRLAVPRDARLDVGLGVLRDGEPVTFVISATPAGGETRRLLEETYSDARYWDDRSVDLSELAGQTVTLTLETRAESPGSVAFWAAPTVGGPRSSDKPNVIFYVIDGAGADYMSVYGYNRRTTPNLERIAAEGAVFERAHSNSSWTRPSTPSFLTSLHHSVLGGQRNGRNPVPNEALTMAEHMHRAGYLTASFVSNANAGSMSDLERGLDLFRETGVKPNSISSVELHDNFWSWRRIYPLEPYWVHFQTTDVHNDHAPVAPFAGLFITPERRRLADEWLAKTEELPETSDFKVTDAVDAIGVSQVDYWSAQRDLHDETMAHQDYQLGQLVARLKATGEWNRTLLIVAGDHSVAAGSWDYFLLARDPQPPDVFHDDRRTPMLRSGVSRVPLIVVWPQRIAPGQRFTQPVSMIDVLPTILDLTGLPMPEVMQGQSLVPLMFGKPGWEARPVILDEFEVDPETGMLSGRIEVIDGRWGASLEINPGPDTPPERRRPAPLLLFDLWNDPHCLLSLHEERPDLAEKYTVFLEQQLEAHRNLAEHFTRSEDSPLTPEQLETLRSLGYIQ